MTLGGYRIGPLLKKTGQEILADDLTALAAEAAYNFFFSIFPFFLLAGSIFGLLSEGTRTANWILSRLADAVPAQAAGLVRGVVHDIVFARNAPGLVSIGALLTAWSGAGIFRSLMSALNRTYNVPETRPFWKRALISVAFLIGTGLMLVIASTIMLAGPEIAAGLGERLHVEAALVAAWQAAQYPLAFLLLLLAYFLIYRFLPNVRHERMGPILVGAGVAALLWIGITLLFRLYVANFGSYNTTYGTIGAVMVLLTWMYLTMLVVLAAGELIAELERETGAARPASGSEATRTAGGTREGPAEEAHVGPQRRSAP